MGPFSDSHGCGPSLFDVLFWVAIGSAAWLFNKGREHARGKQAAVPGSTAAPGSPRPKAPQALLVAALAAVIVVLFALLMRGSHGVTKPESPKPPPVVVVAPASTDTVKKTLDHAAALIRETAPLYAEISDGIEAGDPGRDALRGRVEKIERVRANLREARRLYSDVRTAAPNPALIEGRIRKIDSLLETTADWLARIEYRPASSSPATK